MNSQTRLIFRADGNSQIGLGHVVRCLALAELLHHRFHCVFAIQNPSPALTEQIKAFCPEIINLPENAENLESEAENLVQTFTGHEIVVLDGYQFSSRYQQLLKTKNSLLVCLDDLHDRQFLADTIINIAGGVTPEAYQAAPYTRFCLGPAYALLRKPFREAQKTLGKKPKIQNRLLICFGGADPENFTLQYVQKILALNLNFLIEVVVGSAYKHLPALQEIIAENPQVQLHQNLTAPEMADLMVSCPVALTSASSVAYEYCAVNGLLFLEKTAVNQSDLYQFLLSENLALPAADLEKTLSQPDLNFAAAALIQNQRQIFNGQAENNLLQLFEQLRLQAQLTFRKLTLADAPLLFEWANDPVVRQYSFNAEPIPWETHQNWVQNKLANPNALLLLAEIENQPAAFLRFDKTGNQAMISYQIGASFRGKGLGHRVLQIGLQELNAHFPEVDAAFGFVQPQNVASVRAFEKAEFENKGIDLAHKAYKFSASLN